MSIKPGSNFMPRLKPSCWSLSLISFSDFLPKFRYFSISASVFWASCPTVVMFALFRLEEHTSELQSRLHLVCRLLLEKKKHIGCSVRSLTTTYNTPHQL